VDGLYLLSRYNTFTSLLCLTILYNLYIRVALMLTYLAFLINYQNSLCPQIFCLLDFACGILTVKVTQLV